MLGFCCAVTEAMTEKTVPAPGHQEPTAVDKLDSNEIEKIGNVKVDATSSTNEEELEPVVTAKTWMVVGV